MIKKSFLAGRWLIRIVLQSGLGALVLVIILIQVDLNSRPDLSVWHTTVLEEEFQADSGMDDFNQYVELEERLFEQLDREIYQKIEDKEQSAFNRYHLGSLADPRRWPVNWNHSFVLPVDDPKFSVLLLHGLSDSPYSMRSTGRSLHELGGYVIGLRVPGHGQAPSGLLDVTWEDMAAAVRLAMKALVEKSGGAPVYIIGYSNGGALAVQYTLDSLSDTSLNVVDGVILMSPEIGISRLAVFAKWQLALSHLLGYEKLAWNSLLPEYDPWKYGSFAINAGAQAHRITQRIQTQITEQKAARTLQRMPPILAFQSVVDSTVSAQALVDNLFERLPAISVETDNVNRNTHQLVLFGIDRYADMEPIMVENPTAWVDPMLARLNHSFELTLLSNRDQSDQELVAFSRMPGSSDVEICDTDLEWPADVYSLSHIALPFPPDDPVYGGDTALPSPGIQLGSLAKRGEKNVLRIPAPDMLRLRHNPFYSYQEQRLLAFLGYQTNLGRSCFSP